MPQDNKIYQELLKQKDEISKQKKEIIESLEYACLIQTALLPQSSSIHNTLHDSFILYLPKDIVSGDFYWISEHEENVLFAAVDEDESSEDMKGFEKLIQFLHLILCAR